MKSCTVCFFGHRRIDDLDDIEQKLVPIIQNLIHTQDFVEFLIGRNGEFDEFAASVIKRVQRREERRNSELTLVLPYKVAQVEYYEKYYDNVIIPEVAERSHPKRAITVRNRYMVDISDIVIAYVEKTGGDHTILKYAEEHGVKTINLKLGWKENNFDL